MLLSLIFFLLSITHTVCADKPATISESGSYLAIDPKIMSQDVIEAFNFLTEKKKSVEVHLKNKEILTQIKSVSALSGGYFMLFTLKSLKGDQYKIVPLTDILSIASI